MGSARKARYRRSRCCDSTTRANFEVLTRKFGYFSRRFLASAPTFVGDMNILETDPFKEIIAHTIEHYARSGLTGSEFLRPWQIFMLAPLSNNCGANSVEVDVAHNSLHRLNSLNGSAAPSRVKANRDWPRHVLQDQV